MKAQKIQAKHLAGVVLLTAAVLIPTLSGALAEERITFEKGELTIESQENDKLIVIDTEGLKAMVGATMDETMEGMGDMLAELDEMQLEIRLGEDNNLSIETDDQSWEMNLDLIFMEIGNALETAFEDMDTDEWTVHSHHSDHFSDVEIDEEELEVELKRLKKELRRLQKELDKVKEL